MMLQRMHLTLKEPSKFHFAKFSDNIIKTPIMMEEQISDSRVNKNPSLAYNAHHHRCEYAGGRTWACAVRGTTALGTFVGCGQDLQKVDDTIYSSSLPRAVSFLRRQQCTSRRSFVRLTSSVHVMMTMQVRARCEIRRREIVSRVQRWCFPILSRGGKKLLCSIFGLCC